MAHEDRIEAYVGAILAVIKFTAALDIVNVWK